MKINYKEIPINEGHLKQYFETAIERQRIFKRRDYDRTQPPWTKNRIFQEYKFCNVFREQDKNTRWIFDNLISHDDMGFALCAAYRAINNYETFCLIANEGRVLEIETVYRTLEKYKHRKGMGTCAYMFLFRKHKNLRNYVRYIYTAVQGIETQLYNLLEEGSIEDMFNFFLSKNFDGVGRFMAYEYVCDFFYFRKLGTWKIPFKDETTWANAGPGCKRGLQLVFNLQGKPPSPELALNLMRRLRELWIRYMGGIPIDEDDTFLPLLWEPSLRTIEHWLCEYSKYVKYNTYSKRGIAFNHRKLITI